MKKLVSLKDIEEAVSKGQTSICIDKDTLITPSAKDMIREKGLELCEQECCCPSEPVASCGEGLSSDFIFNALMKMSESGMLNDVLAKCAMAVEEKPYTAEYDPSGFKLVRGSVVKMDVLETGNPADDGKVKYQELIGANDKSSMNAGFMTIDACTFDWDVQCEEIYYIVEGSITVTIDGRAYVAYEGDSLFIQKGSKVVFSAPNRVKVFYSTY